MNDSLARGVRVSWTAEGFARIHRMAEAEKLFEAMGLL
jgi:hypothetical protein